MPYTKEQIRKEYLKGDSERYSKSKDIEIQKFIENTINFSLQHKEKVYCHI